MKFTLENLKKLFNNTCNRVFDLDRHKMGGKGPFCEADGTSLNKLFIFFLN